MFKKNNIFWFNEYIIHIKLKKIYIIMIKMKNKTF